MGTRHYRIRNNKRNSAVCTDVQVIDATLEPLTILKVLVEGLAENAETGLWLTNMTTGIPMVPRISPFALLYLDKSHRVLQAVELLPVDAFPLFKKPAVSALVLPLRSIASSKTRPGDLLVFIEIEEEDELVAVPAEVALVATEASVSAPPATADENPSFELDACAPEREAEVVVPEEEHVTLLASHLPETQSAVTLGFETPPERSSIAIVSAPEEPAAEPSEELPTFAENPIELPPARIEVPAPKIVRRARVLPPATKEKEKGDSAKENESEKEPREKDWAVSRLLRWLYPGAYEKDRRKGRRIPIPNLVAYDTTTGVAQSFEVGDISATGMFLLTEERWPPGSVLSLSIQREGPQEVGIERRIQMQAGAVRVAQNGVGFSFVLPDGMELHLWEEPAKDERRQSAPEYVVREFRMAKALAFINRIAAPASEESRYLIYEELSNVRSDSAVSIFLKAEQRLAQEEGGSALLAHPDVVVGVVEGGSWADSEWMQDLWAGLLVSSCSPDGCDDSSLILVTLLSQQSKLQTRILAAVCEKAITVAGGTWAVPSEKIFSSADELTKMAGSHDLLKIHRCLAQLAEFGLLEKSVRASFVSETEGTTTNPTAFGLRMYSRCLGRRGNL